MLPNVKILTFRFFVFPVAFLLLVVVGSIPGDKGPGVFPETLKFIYYVKQNF